MVRRWGIWRSGPGRSPTADDPVRAASLEIAAAHTLASLPGSQPGPVIPGILRPDLLVPACASAPASDVCAHRCHHHGVAKRISRLFGSACVGSLAIAALVAIPSSEAAAAALPALSVQPSSGPVGSEITIKLESSGCGSVVFRPAGESTVGLAVSPGSNGSEQVLVPSFVGTAPATPVGPGKYQLAVSCPASTPTGFTNFTVPFTVTSAVTSPGRFVAMASTPDGGGYWLAQSGGGVYSFGDAKFEGSLPGLGVVPSTPIVGMAATPDGGGYWLVASDGGVFAFGDAKFEGSLPGLGIVPAAPIMSMASTDFGGGYWLMGGDGGVFAFGDAPFCTPLLVTAGGLELPGYVQGPAPYVGIAAAPGSVGYDIASSFGNGLSLPPPNEACDAATFNGEYGSINLPGFVTTSAAISGVATSVTGERLWLVGLDGGVFAPEIQTEQGLVSPSPFFGSLPGLGVVPATPIVGMAATPDGGGYWLVGADGGVFAFGDARFFGSAAD